MSGRARPPRPLVALLSAALPSDRHGRARLGDLLEEHGEVASRRGWIYAHLWLAAQAVGLALRGGFRAVADPGELLTDLRSALRGMRRQPALTLVLIGTLGLGAGAGTAVFAVVDTLLFRPLPFDEPGELVRIWAAEEGGNDRLPLTYDDLPDFAGARTLESVAGVSLVRRTLLDDDRSDPRPVTVARTLGDLGRLLGAVPIVGRLPSADELASGAPIALVSEGLWQRRFAGEAGAVGRWLQLDDGAIEIVGVLPGDRLYPTGVDVWRPLDPRVEQDEDREVVGLARLADGVSMEAAAVEVSAIAHRQAERHPGSHGSVSAWVQPLQLTLVGDVRTTLLAFLGSVGVLLLIIGLNIAHLLLARARDRAHETAVRISMGITRGRLFRMHLVESLVLGLLAGALGIGLGRLALGAALRLAPDLSQLATIDVDLRVALVGGGTSVLAGLIFGFVPALRTAAQDPKMALSAGGRGGLRGPGRGFGSFLVTTEVALSTALVVLAVALAGTFRSVLDYDRGFEADGLIAFDIDVGHESHDAETEIDPQDRLTRLLDAVGRLPTVAGLGFTSHPLTEQRGLQVEVRIDGVAPTSGAREPATTRIVSEGFFGAARIAVVEGRDFSDDWELSAGEIVVNEHFVRTFLSGADSPLGRAVQTDWAEGRVVGVVADVSPAVDEPARPIVYLHLAQVPFGGSLLMVRSPAVPAVVVPEVWHAIQDVDPEVIPRETEVLATSVRGSVAAERFNMTVVGAFAALALLLAALGIFGMTTHAVAARRHEIGLRRALGASPRRVVGEVMRSTAGIVALGAVLGVFGAVFAGGLVESLFVGVEPSDPRLVAAVVAVLVAIAALAAALPIRRAVQVEPTEALRM